MAISIIQSSQSIINQAEAEKRLLSNLLIEENATVFNATLINSSSVRPWNDTTQTVTFDSQHIAIQPYVLSDLSVGDLVSLTLRDNSTVYKEVLYTVDMYNSTSYIIDVPFSDFDGVPVLYKNEVKNGFFNRIYTDAYSNNLDISNDATASFKHEYFINHNLVFLVGGNGNSDIQVQSEILTIAQLTEIQNCFSGKMNGTEGYYIDENLLLQKLQEFNIVTENYFRLIKSSTSFGSKIGSSKHVLQKKTFKTSADFEFSVIGNYEVTVTLIDEYYFYNFTSLVTDGEILKINSVDFNNVILNHTGGDYTSIEGIVGVFTVTVSKMIIKTYNQF